MNDLDQQGSDTRHVRVHVPQPSDGADHPTRAYATGIAYVGSRLARGLQAGPRRRPVWAPRATAPTVNDVAARRESGRRGQRQDGADRERRGGTARKRQQRPTRAARDACRGQYS
ncbi:hypothetical protein GCM10022255_105770 [Dactylosporangium darangshiense]|uniref:Uncharacterized protein n=1 Tax=Dactylosporangium darangshiense TaxID=579108 RepID=A0ABP8DTP2_9ACTN